MFNLFCILFVFSSFYEAEGQWMFSGDYNSYNPFNPFRNALYFGGFTPSPKFNSFNTFPTKYQFPGIYPFPIINTLGQQITEEIEQKLLPVKQNTAKQSMMKGVGGVTIVVIPRLNWQLLMNEGVAYICRGQIQVNRGNQPTCSGNLLLIQDVCVPGQNFIQFNNVKCFGENVSMLNGACVNGQQLSLAELKTKCGPDYDTNNYAQFDYYPTKGKLNAIEFRNIGTVCANSDKNHCVFN